MSVKEYEVQQRWNALVLMCFDVHASCLCSIPIPPVSLGEWEIPGAGRPFKWNSWAGQCLSAAVTAAVPSAQWSVYRKLANLRQACGTGQVILSTSLNPSSAPAMCRIGVYFLSFSSFRNVDLQIKTCISYTDLCMCRFIWESWQLSRHGG